MTGSHPSPPHSATEQKRLSLVIPCYNEEEVLGQTFARLQKIAETLWRTWHFETEIVFVNDGSKDRTLSLLQAYAENTSVQHMQVRVVSLARNFGHQAAMAAGLLYARGQWIVTIDADLQDPPELIADMLKMAIEGPFDVIHGKRRSRDGESLFKLTTAYVFYRVLNWLSRGRALNDVGDFRLMSRRVVDTINSLPERSLYLRGLLPELGFPQASLAYDRPARAAGETKYTLIKMMALAFEGITAVSVAPLRVGLALGAASALLCLLYLTLIFVEKILDPSFAVRGWPSLMVAILFLGSIQLLSIGILGEYIGQIHREVKNRPRFFVDHMTSRLGPSPRAASLAQTETDPPRA